MFPAPSTALLPQIRLHDWERPHRVLVLRRPHPPLPLVLVSANQLDGVCQLDWEALLPASEGLLLRQVALGATLLLLRADSQEHHRQDSPDAEDHPADRVSFPYRTLLLFFFLLTSSSRFCSSTRIPAGRARWTA